MRWTPKRKAQFVIDCLAQNVSDDTIIANGFSPDEFEEMRKRYVKHGVAGLKATKTMKMLE